MKGKMKLILIIALIATLLIGCSGKPVDKTNESGGEQSQEVQVNVSNPENEEEFDDSKLPPIPEDGYYLKSSTAKPESFLMEGFDGDEPGWAGDLSLTPEEVKQVRQKKLRIAYEMPNESEFSEVVLSGIKRGCDMLGIEIVATGVCENDPAVQKENMENFMALNVDYIVSQAQEVDIAPTTYDPLRDAGIGLLFQANVPTGYEAGKDYVAGVGSDFYEYGYQAADAMAEVLGGKGKVAIIYLAAVNPISNARDGAFVERIKEKYPDIELVEEAGIEQVTDAGTVASALLTRYPDLDGLHVTFVEPATEVLEVVRSLNMDNLVMTTVDFNSMAALDMAKGGNVDSIVVDSTVQYGETQPLLIAYDALGKDLSSSTYMVPIFTVKINNLEEGWESAFGAELPAEVKEVLDNK